MAVNIMCTSGQAIIKAGKNVFGGFVSGMAISGNHTFMPGAVENLIDEGEGFINGVTKFNFSNSFGTLSENTKHILQAIVSDIAAIHMVKHDLSGYSSRVEAEDIINVLRDEKLMGLMVIRDKETQGFILRPSEGVA